MDSRGSGASAKRKSARSGGSPKTVVSNVKKTARALARRGPRNVAIKIQHSTRIRSKLAISFERRLADDVRRAAKLQTEGDVSAWLAEAARDRLRQLHMQAALNAYEGKHGVITEEELAEIRREWPR